jgi:DUF4097 and DUF4098 domain-containing protein YvlB
MKKIQILTTLIWVMSVMILQAQNQEVTIPFSNPAAQKTLKINISTGKILIKGSDRQDVLVQYSVEEQKEKETDKDDKFAGMKRISGSNLSFEMGEDNNLAYIESSNWFNPMNLEIEVPNSIDLKIQNNMGEEIKIEGIEGNINVESNMGSITLNDISGIANVSSNVGSIKVVFKKISDPKNMLFSTTMGDVDITLPANLGADLKLITNWGEIYSDLDISIDPAKAQVQKIEDGDKIKVVKESWTTGKLNGGGVGLTLKTKMGDIFLRQGK